MIKFILQILLGVILITINNKTYCQQEHEVDELNNQAYGLIRSHPDSASLLLMKSFELAFENGYYKGAANALKLKGQSFMIQRKDFESLETFQKAINLYNRTGSTSLNDKHVAYRNMAAILSRNNNYKMALTCYDSAESNLTEFIKRFPENARKNSSKVFLNDLLYYKSINLKKSGDLIEASKTLTELWESSEPVSSHGRVLNQLGLINKDLKNYNEAKYFYRQVLELSDIRPTDKGHALHNYGYTFILERRYDSARWYLEQATNQWQSILSDNNTSNTASKGLFRSRLDLGECLFNQGLYGQAIDYWENALQLNLKIDKNPELFIIHNWLQQSYMLFDIEKANVHGQIYKGYLDEFLNNKSMVAAQFEGQVFRLRLQERDASNGYLQALSKQQKTFYIQLLLAISCSLLLFYICFRLVKRYRHRRFHSKMYRIATKKDQ